MEATCPEDVEDWIAGLFTDTKYGSMKKIKITRATYPVETGRKLNVRKTNVLHTFNLRPLSTG